MACFDHLFLSCFVPFFVVLKFLLLVTINLKCSILPLKMRASFLFIYLFFWSFIFTWFCEALSDTLKNKKIKKKRCYYL